MSMSKKISAQHVAEKHYKLALKCINNQNFGLALGNLLLVVKLLPEKLCELQQIIAGCLGKFIYNLYHQHILLLNCASLLVRNFIFAHFHP